MEVPDTWKNTKLKLISKKSYPELPKNCRPISIIPVLAKLYSIILYNRVRVLVNSQLADEQFAFRKGRGCADAVHILRTVIENSAEWGEDLWITTLDVETALDQVHHSSLFDALLAGGVGTSIIGALRNLRANLQASVVVVQGEVSRNFEVQRGIRQGDPLSPLLFSLVLHQVLEEVRSVWKRHKNRSILPQRSLDTCRFCRRHDVGGGELAINESHAIYIEGGATWEEASSYILPSVRSRQIFANGR